MSQTLHLTASMRVIKAHEGGRVTIAWAKRRVAEAAGRDNRPGPPAAAREARANLPLLDCRAGEDRGNMGALE